jgi:predicted aldo/keto reductase-like oxidoreductase
VTVVLSGMNDEAHIDENIASASSAFPGSMPEDELAVVRKARDEYLRLMKVGCTGCGYCMPCPAGVDIPGCFSLYNSNALFPHDRTVRFVYMARHGGILGARSYAGLCRECGKCARACPQHLPIPERLKGVSGDLDRMMWLFVPIMKGALGCMNAIERLKRAFTGKGKADA